MTILRPTLLAAALLVSACGAPDADSSASATMESPLDSLFPDDAYTISATRPITDVERKIVAFNVLGVTVSNDFEGGRFNAATTDGDSVLVLTIRPENSPINNSAWYAFKAWAPAPDSITVRLTYEGGRHRFLPKVRTSSEPDWTTLDTAAVLVGPEARDVARFRIAVGPDTTWVAGQEMLTSSWFADWVDGLTAREGVTQRTIGTTPRGRDLNMFEAGEPDADRHVLFISRQHPPEVTGTFAFVAFMEEMLGDSPLAQEFRSEFRIHAVPLMNPDGVDLGHWRHSTGGIDLNRDWVAFHQPETRAVRDDMARVLADESQELWFFADFHSTNRDVFYTLDRALETRPAGVLDPWIEHIRTAMPDYELEDAPSDGGYGVVSRDWAWREHRAPGMVYEVGDDTPRGLIREVAETAARGTMQILLERARGG
ncbi:M14 family metallopeptidase [Gemmatimonadota bacterium Y43]|uniref:M14 family metallopeptidase n=1 Tax=Gaopeijia maritima TaxID=3119007 RepID=UPI003277CCF2